MNDYDRGYLRGYRHGVMDITGILRTVLGAHTRMDLARIDVTTRITKLLKVLKDD